MLREANVFDVCDNDNTRLSESGNVEKSSSNPFCVNAFDTFLFFFDFTFPLLNIIE
jgi:hypothetical protein